MLILISYDIENDKTRTKLAKRLLDFGPRVQFSVFEADVKEAELSKLQHVCAATDLKGDDSIRLYRLCEGCRSRIVLYGAGKKTEDQAFYIA